MTNRTIFALATAPARSGVAVIRISGEAALSALAMLTGISQPIARHVYYCAIRHPSSAAVIDKGIAMYFQAPHSFTGEDVVELHLHGSMAVIREVLDVLAGLAGMYMAEPGEFTRRAFINGKMDLLEAEGLADLINADTNAQKTQAMRQMQGEMSVFYDDIRGSTINCLALLEAYIDFPDEEIPESVLTKWRETIISLQNSINNALADGKRGERLRDGLSIVIVGAPNAGKSSLLNTLAGRDAAIVSNHAGTTRDAIEIHMDIAGYPVIITDTAGLRESENEIEQEGIRRALARAGSADLKLALFDASELPEMDKSTKELLDENTIVIISKIDTVNGSSLRGVTLQLKAEEDDVAIQNLDTAGLLRFARNDNIIQISTKTGQGIDQLIALIEEKVKDFFVSGSAPFITRSRHRLLLLEAEMLLKAALIPKPLELSCEELRRAALAIGKITGKIQIDDVLDVIFKQFCIGK